MKTKTKKKDDRRYGSFWKCLTCADQPEFEHKDAMKHFADVHGIDTENTKGRKSMLMHLDGDTWFSWDYEWTIGDVKAHQHTCSKRSRDDQMYWQ